VIGVNRLVQPFLVGYVPPDENGGVRLVTAYQFTHFPDLADIGKDGAYSDDVIGCFFKFPNEAIQGGKIEDRARCVDVRLEQQQGERAVKHAQGKSPLYTRDLIVVKLHRVDGAAAVFIILCERTEHTA
jgi:hypothetical protein